MNNDEVAELHIKNGFFVRVQQLKASAGCFVEYPKIISKIKTIEPYITCYMVDGTKIKVNSEYEKRSGKLVEIEAPLYSIRTLILEDIFLTLHRNGLHTKLVFFFDKDGKRMKGIPDFTSMIDLKLDPLEISNESCLGELLGNILSGMDCSQQAFDNNIENGYVIAKKIFDDGGICHD